MAVICTIIFISVWVTQEKQDISFADVVILVNMYTDLNLTDSQPKNKGLICQINVQSFQKVQ